MKQFEVKTNGKRARRYDRTSHIIKLNPLTSGVRFSKAPETFRACKAIFRSSVPENGEVYTPETSSMKGISLHLQNM